MIDGLCSFVGPDLYNLTCCGELVLLRRVIDVTEDKFTHVFGKRLDCFFLFVQTKISVYVLIVILRFEHAFKIVEVDGFVC